MSTDADRTSAAATSPAGGIWTPAYRPLTVGLVLAVTFVAFEALAVATILPVVGRQLGDLRLYGWVFSAFLLASLIGIVLAGTLADRMPLGRLMLPLRQMPPSLTTTRRASPVRAPRNWNPAMMFIAIRPR